MTQKDCFPGMTVDTEAENTRSVLQNESVVEVEIPVRGLLIKESVIVSNCNSDHIEAQTSNISHFCTGTYNYPLFIREQNSNRRLACRLSDLLVYSGKLFLSDVQSLEQSWIDREFERVQPKNPLYATILINKQKVRANVFDLSKNGICILIGKEGFAYEDEPLNKLVQILLRLPAQNTTCKIKGKIVQSRPIGNSLLRIGVETSPTNKDAKIIAHYLTERKREILDDLFVNFLQLMNYREAKDQYF